MLQQYVVSPTLLMIAKTLNNIVTLDSGSTILVNVVDNCDYHGLNNIVSACWTRDSGKSIIGGGPYLYIHVHRA